MSSSSTEWIDDLFNSQLKTVSLNEIEAAISTCLGELVGDTYSIRITSLEFDPPLRQNAKMTMTIEHRLPRELFSSLSDSPESDTPAEG